MNGIKNIADQAERFRALEAVLAKYGVTQDLIAASANTTAVQYEKLKGAFDDAFAALGQGLAKVGTSSGIIQDLTNKLNSVSTGITSLATISDKKLGVENAMLSASTTVDQFNEKIRQTNALIDQQATVKNAGILGALTLQKLKIDEVTQAEFTFIQATVQAGGSLQAAQGIISGVSTSLTALENKFRIVGDSFGASRQELTNFENAMLLASSASAEGAGIAKAFANAVLSGNMSVQEATFKLQAYSVGIAENTARHQENANATQTAASATQVMTTELGASAIKAAEASQQTAQLKSLQEALANISGAVASGHITAANAAATLASQYSIASGEAQRLIGLQLQLAGLSLKGIPTDKRRRGQEGGLLGGGSTPKDDISYEAAKANQQFLENQKKYTDNLRQADINLARAKGDTRTAVDLLRKSQQGLNKDSAEYKNIEAQIINMEDKANKKGRKGAKNPKLTANEKLGNQLLAQDDKFDAKMEDLERNHQQKLLDIINEFNKKQLQTQKENEVLKRRSRFDFYTNLNKSDIAPVDKQKFAQAYEEAFSEAQNIARSGRAKLAQEFLALRKSQIDELEQLAQEEASIKNDKDVSKKDKNAQLADLEARRKLLLEAQAEEKKNLIEGGDQNVNELNQKLADENKAYNKQSDEITLAANRTAEAKIAASERAKIKVSEENKELAKQVGLFNDINKARAGINGTNTDTSSITSTTPKTETAAQPSTPVAVTTPIDVKPTQPIPVTLPPVTTVTPGSLFIVRDDAVTAAIGDQTARLEGKLGEVIATLGSLNTSLGGKIDGLKGAIGTIKLARP